MTASGKKPSKPKTPVARSGRGRKAVPGAKTRKTPATGGTLKPPRRRLPRLRESLGERKIRAARIADGLARLWPDAGCELEHRSPWELLIATILSAQCTDKMVNQVTRALFDEFPDPSALAASSQERVEELIRRTGFFSQKARAIRECARLVCENHDGAVPATIEELVQLKGVGRKTASVVLGTAFGEAAIFVDTHVKRLTARFGLTTEGTPEKIETDLRKLLPPERWTAFCHRTIHHGRKQCHARKPLCEACLIADICPRIGV